MIMADMGADVLKVEHPQMGDLARGNGPFIGDDLSSYFLSLNRGKKSMTLNLATEQGREVLIRLVEWADVLLENFVPGTMKRFGVDYPVLKEANPRLIYAAISGFGQEGPYSQRPALDVIVQGMGGIMSITGEPGGPPVRPGVSLGDIAAGMFCNIGILAALQERERSGQGQMVDVAMLDSQLALLENAFARYFATGDVPVPLGTRHPVYTPFQAFETKDGNIVIATVGGTSNQWALLCSAIDRVDLIDDPRFETGGARTEHYEEVEPILSGAIRQKTTDEWLTILTELGIPCGPINRIDQVAADTQVAFREMIIPLNHPRVGEVRVVGAPFKFSRSSTGPDKASPDLGEHTSEVLTQILGMSEAEMESLRETGAI
jgi:CoA:oxalate CoA-transferase